MHILYGHELLADHQRRTDPSSGWTTTALGDDRPSSTTEYCIVPFISLTVILLSFTSAQYNFLHTASSQMYG